MIPTVPTFSTDESQLTPYGSVNWTNELSFAQPTTRVKRYMPYIAR